MRNTGNFGKGALQFSKKKKPPAFGRRLLFSLGLFICRDKELPAPKARGAKCRFLKIVAGAKVPRESREVDLQGWPNLRVWLSPFVDCAPRCQSPMAEACRRHTAARGPAAAKAANARVHWVFLYADKTGRWDPRLQATTGDFGRTRRTAANDFRRVRAFSAGPENVDWPNISARDHYFVDGDFGRARRTAADNFRRVRAASDVFRWPPQKKAGQTLTL